MGGAENLSQNESGAFVRRKNEPFVVKKYANRRLYNTKTSSYVSLSDIFDMVKAGEDFRVVDVKTDEDITHSVLTQVIFEQESKGLYLLPTGFLRQLIRCYGHSSAPYVADYLTRSMQMFTDHQENMRGMMSGAVEALPGGMFREVVKSQLDWWQSAWGFPMQKNQTTDIVPPSEDEQENERPSSADPTEGPSRG